MKVKFTLLRKIESAELTISDSAYNVPQKDVEWCCNIIILYSLLNYSLLFVEVFGISVQLYLDLLLQTPTLCLIHLPLMRYLH